MKLLMPENFKVNNFDSIRIMAATQVMIMHTLFHLDLGSYWWSRVIGSFPGVAIFFVTSGFLISASLERSRSIKQYAIKRCLRIYPALWCCLIATAVTCAVFQFDVLSREAAIWLSLQSIGVIYTPQFLKGFGFGSYNGSLWTIPVELQFYLILPAIYFLLKKSKNNSTLWLIFLFFLAASIIIKIIFPNMGKLELQDIFEKLLNYTFIPHIYLFLFGVVMQKYEFYKSPWIRGKALYWLLAYALVEIQVSGTVAGWFFGTLILGILTVSSAYTLPTITERIFRGNDISYGTYIYHGLVINIFIESGITGRLIYLPILMATTYGIAYCSWRYVERPLIRRRQAIITDPKCVKSPVLM